MYTVTRINNYRGYHGIQGPGTDSFGHWYVSSQSYLQRSHDSQRLSSFYLNNFFTPAWPSLASAFEVTALLRYRISTIIMPLLACESFSRWRCLSVRLFVRSFVRLFVCLSPVKFVKSFATWQHLSAAACRIDSDTLVAATTTFTTATILLLLLDPDLFNLSITLANTVRL